MIRKLDNEARAERLVGAAIRRMNLDLSGLTVLTEVASGPFVLTPMIAAAAGAKVVAVTRDSRFGAANDVLGYAGEIASRFGIRDRIEFTADPARRFSSRADIITNLGFVRPIDRAFVSQLKSSAMICLMWAPWEFRDADIDRDACKEANIPIVGTNEEHPDIRTLEYVGLLAVKLLLERHIEILGARVSVLASNPFGKFICKALERLGAIVRHVDPTAHQHDLQAVLEEASDAADAVVLAEHRDTRTLVGPKGVAEDKLRCQGTEIIHICGAITLSPDASDASLQGNKHPLHNVPFGVMTCTTDYLGAKPVVDLHAGGLKVGEIVARARRGGLGLQDAVKRAETSGYGAALR